jgi:hypothetical protein
VDPVLTLADQRLDVEPAGEARVGAAVRDVGDVVEQYRLEVLGDAAAWSQVIPRQISVLPGDHAETRVEVVFRPPPSPLTVAGQVPFGLRRVSLEEPDRCAVVEGDAIVGAVIGVEARIEPVSPAGRWTGRYRLIFDNTGSVATRLSLGVHDNRRMLRFVLAPAEITVEPGRSATACVPPTAVDDKASQGVAETLVARLQRAGVPAELVDSRTSERLGDGSGGAGLWVVLRDGFPDMPSAIAECDAHCDIAPDCYASPPP